MTEVEFLDAYRGQANSLMLYGDFVILSITAAIEAELNVDISKFLKVPLQARIKDEASLIQKAFYRNKNYNDPFNEITDKIGIRIVVLLEEDVHAVCTIIERLKSFTCSKDRDFVTERDNSPESFRYQSNHYILRNVVPLEFDPPIEPGMPAEVQVRTLLQHAWSELTHDTVYKPNTYASPQVQRKVAQATAMIELTDRIFSEVHQSVNSFDIAFENLLRELEQLFPVDIKPVSDNVVNRYLLDTYNEELKTFSIAAFKHFLLDNRFIWERIKARSQRKQLFNLTIMPLMYYLARTKRHIMKAKWPLGEEDLELMFTDLGISIKR
jgi:GTP pyrophosphokinase